MKSPKPPHIRAISKQRITSVLLILLAPAFLYGHPTSPATGFAEPEFGRTLGQVSLGVACGLVTGLLGSAIGGEIYKATHPPRDTSATLDGVIGRAVYTLDALPYFLAGWGIGYPLGNAGGIWAIGPDKRKELLKPAFVGSLGGQLLGLMTATLILKGNDDSSLGIVAFLAIPPACGTLAYYKLGKPRRFNPSRTVEIFPNPPIIAFQNTAVAVHSTLLRINLKSF